MAGRGWNIFATEGSGEALEVARKVPLDFGILDLHLPGTTGLDLFQTISREIGPMPSIMMSGEASRSETDAALAAGVFTFLKKPIALPELQRSLDLLIQTHFPQSPGLPT